VVTLNGLDIYLGKWNTKASQSEYERVIAEWLAGGRMLPSRDNDLTVAELALAYWRFARRYYRKGGGHTSTIDGIRQSLRALRRLYGSLRAKSFGPRSLTALRRVLIESGRLNRDTINKRISTVRWMFKWGVAEELIPPSVHQALAAVEGLRKGRTKAREAKPIPPVADNVVEATLPHLPTVVADMVRFQRLTGCRPAEVCIVRSCDVDTSGDVWIYRPESHKAEHHGRERIICIGPKGQAVLCPYLLRPEDCYCFSPIDSERKRLADRHDRRRTPSSCGNRPGSNRKRRPKRKPRQRYDTNSYRRAIHRAVDLANRERGKDDLLPKWSPNRLRHSAATEIRRRFGLEAAQVTLGHATADVSQIYAERDLSLAVKIMRKIG
jgi:integrase